MSFMAASLSPRGLTLHPGGRNEGPLFYFLFDGLVDDVSLKYVSIGQENPRAYFVNAYVHLVDSQKRRNAISKKQKDDKLDSPNQAKKPKMVMNQMNVRRPPFQFTPPAAPVEIQHMQQQLNSLVDVIQERMPPGQVGPAFPSLPQAAPVQWPGFHNLPVLPDDE